MQAKSFSNSGGICPKIPFLTYKLIFFIHTGRHFALSFPNHVDLSIFLCMFSTKWRIHIHEVTSSNYTQRLGTCFIDRLLSLSYATWTQGRGRRQTCTAILFPLVSLSLLMSGALFSRSNTNLKTGFEVSCLFMHIHSDFFSLSSVHIKICYGIFSSQVQSHNELIVKIIPRFLQEPESMMLPTTTRPLILADPHFFISDEFSTFSSTALHCPVLPVVNQDCQVLYTTTCR